MELSQGKMFAKRFLTLLCCLLATSCEANGSDPRDCHTHTHTHTIVNMREREGGREESYLVRSITTVVKGKDSEREGVSLTDSLWDRDGGKALHLITGLYLLLPGLVTLVGRRAA